MHSVAPPRLLQQALELGCQGAGAGGRAAGALLAGGGQNRQADGQRRVKSVVMVAA